MKQALHLCGIFAVAILIVACVENAGGNIDKSNQKTDSTVVDSTGVDSTEQAELIIQPPDSIDEILGLGSIQFGDLDSMIARRDIRVLVPYSPSFYYIDGKEREGLSLDMANLFEESVNDQLGFRSHKLNLIFIPVAREHMIRLLNEGYGDLAIGGVLIDDARLNEVSFSHPTISNLREVIVGGPDAAKISSLADLSGKSVHVNKGSDYFKTLTKLNDFLSLLGIAPVKIIPTDPYLDDEDLLQLVSAGNIPFTVAVEDMALLWQSVLGNMEVYLDIPLKTGVNAAWAFRKESPQLEKVVNHFINKNKKGTRIGNILFKKYFAGKGQLEKVTSPEAMERLQSTKAIFQKYAAEYEMDWLFMVAQGYQESGLNHNRSSHAGAVGIMQVKPSTAAGSPVFIKNVYAIDNNIHASAKYMDYIRNRYLQDSSISVIDRELLALASYNAGPNRIRGLRKRAEASGLNPNVWFDNVEIMAAHSMGRKPLPM